MDDYYKTLGITPDTDPEEIRRRYRFLAKAYHPDRFSDVETKAEAEREMQRINEAYSVLSHPEKRQAYDRKQSFGSQSSSSQTSGKTPDEYLDKTSKYLDHLVNKWGLILDKPLNSQEADRVVQNIVGGYSLLIKDVYKTKSADLAKTAMDNIDHCIGLIIAINISLGAELATNGLSPDYSLLDLEVFSCIPFYQMVTGIAKLIRIEKPYATQSIDQITDSMIGLSLHLCDICVKIGQSRVKKPDKTFIDRPPAENKAPFNVNKNSEFCQTCGRNTPTENLAFRQNIGMIIVRSSRKVSGNICASCAESYFWRLSGITLLFGWWGTISFFITPFYLLSNLWNYLRSWKLRSFSSGLWGIELGWKIATLSIVGIAICFFSYFALETLLGVNQSVANQNTSVSYTNPVIIPTPTKKLSLQLPTESYSVLPGHKPRSTSTPETNCVLWTSVTAHDQGETLCVYGKVVDAYFGDNIFFITFSNDVNAFRFIVLDGYYFEVQHNNCVMGEGEVKTYGSMPYIELGENLIDCSEWLP